MVTNGSAAACAVGFELAVNHSLIRTSFFKHCTPDGKV
jgi:hypothetical protein